MAAALQSENYHFFSNMKEKDGEVMKQCSICKDSKKLVSDPNHIKNHFNFYPCRSKFSNFIIFFKLLCWPCSYVWFYLYDKRQLTKIIFFLGGEVFLWAINLGRLVVPFPKWPVWSFPIRETVNHVRLAICRQTNW